MKTLTNINIRLDSSSHKHQVRSFAPAVELQTQLMGEVSGSACGGGNVAGWPQPHSGSTLTSGQVLGVKILARRNGQPLPDSTGFIRSERDRLALEGSSR